MLIYEIKNAVCSKRMLLSQAFVFLCFLVGGADILFRYSEGIDFTYIFFHSISCGASSLVALIYPVLPVCRIPADMKRNAAPAICCFRG